MKINIGTRGSKLALAQANIVQDLLREKYPDIRTNIITIKTTGDKILEKNLNEIGGKGLFIKEIEEHLIEGKVDIAVHSMKDMPAFIHEAFAIPCILKREDSRDAFISYGYKKISQLPDGAVVGSSSPRRVAQLLNARPDIKVVPFRGNIHTRLEKLRNKEVDATFLAMAGLIRAGIKGDNINPIDENEMLPAVAQGAIGIEIRKNEENIKEILSELNHRQTYECVMAERAFLEEFEGSCRTPIGASAKINSEEMSIKFMVASIDGTKLFKTERVCKINNALNASVDAAKELKLKAGNIFL
ncbi:MAG: hydroxymethylbilane synthase [Alphaproteobacteria bacterium CG11_big_fil_rev_8_21_14_0_20_39_49]|nr:MAG: hydroxymethylbilane synthase [Alphaproteobacteria bacterium CG11_big_fil_rev_8_21_14_0_20_39_49]